MEHNVAKQHEKGQILQIAQFEPATNIFQKFFEQTKINLFNFFANENRTRLFQILSLQITRVRIKSMQWKLQRNSNTQTFTLQLSSLFK